MTSIVELFPKCRKLAYDARQQLAQVQQGRPVSELWLILEELHRQLDLMDTLLARETPEKRIAWKHKIDSLRQEAASLQAQGQQAEYSAKNRYQSERDELLLRRRRKPEAEGDLQNLAGEAQSLEQSNLMVNAYIEQGHASLSSLAEQRRRLRGINRVVFDIGTTLGLTQTTMRIIERRDVTDAYLVAGGMVVTCLVIYFVWF